MNPGSPSAFDLSQFAAFGCVLLQDGRQDLKHCMTSNCNESHASAVLQEAHVNRISTWQRRFSRMPSGDMQCACMRGATVSTQSYQCDQLQHGRHEKFLNHQRRVLSRPQRYIQQAGQAYYVTNRIVKHLERTTYRHAANFGHPPTQGLPQSLNTHLVTIPAHIPTHLPQTNGVSRWTVAILPH